MKINLKLKEREQKHETRSVTPFQWPPKPLPSITLDWWSHKPINIADCLSPRVGYSSLNKTLQLADVR